MIKNASDQEPVHVKIEGFLFHLGLDYKKMLEHNLDGDFCKTLTHEETNMWFELHYDIIVSFFFLYFDFRSVVLPKI